ncbi:competence/damage-inducible protein A [Adhaeribacter rhizoryzae]|uniref:CinA-like protein n=1 Tax=Adhaeribacter rhizoryzae TaxID=2607907 RepID=A0A5M6CY64_9BACT|nr:competence/damage-inducible protein A [Adhaeribacter rhizoryzae]KAA5539360.1 competence/damage-inducible protein A [Adhaeribacter rhizoryzae]
MLADIITIGDEILYGQIVDTNSAWLGTELAKIGIKVRQITSISDNTEHILKTLDDVKTQSDVILITGGLGPTKDDLTKHTLCKYFNTQLILDAGSLQHVTELFRSRGRELTELNRQQALLPANCKPVPNILGTAPGMWFEEEGKIFVSMPGVPFEMKRIMLDTVLPELQKRSNKTQIVHRVIQTVGLGESFLADRIADWEEALPPNIKLAYLPSLSGVRLRLTGRATSATNLEEQMDAQVQKLQSLIPEHIFALGEVPLEEALGRLLKEKGFTIATAESCTGGHLAHKLTSIACSSEYFMGSVLAYHNHVKINQLGVSADDLAQYGAVSEEVVSQMAANVRKLLNTDIGVATSGIAGPSGGTPEKPVGTIWVAYADAEKTVAKKIFYNKERLLNIEYTTYTALNLVRQQIMGV